MAEPMTIDHEPQGTAVASTAPQRSTAITPMELLQQAVSKGTDIDQLTKLMDLQDRWQANQARAAFVEAMAEFKSNPPTVVKRKSASFGGRGAAYDYATLDEVSGVIGAALAKYGLSHRWEVEQKDGGAIRVTCVLTHSMGHSERVSLEAAPDTSGSKNSIQAIGSTTTYLERYTLLAATGLAAKGQDNDGGKGRHDEATIDERQKEQIIAKMREVGADTVGFLKYMQIETVDDLPAAEFGRAMKALDAKKQKAEG